MLFNLLYPFHSQVPVLNVIQYITFRTAAASLTALIISLLLGPWLIRKLREFQIGQAIREEGPASHQSKKGTPTMGGLLILTAVTIPTVLWADLRNGFVWIAIASFLAFGAIGRADAQAYLAPLLHDPNPNVRLASATGILQLGRSTYTQSE